MTLRPLPGPGQAPKLKYVHVFSAGTNTLSKTDVFQRPEVVITSSSGSHGPQIAEWVMMTVLAQSHRFEVLKSWQRHSRWGKFDDHFERTRDLVGQRMGILGYGSIGRQGTP
jgi:phosphoglycerate dehydrogenase-like enzyme